MPGLGTLLIVGIIGGIGAAAAFAGGTYAKQKGPELTKSLKATGLSPMPPEEGPPLPSALGVKWPGKK